MTATGDALVLASVSSAPESRLIEDWLQSWRDDNPAANVTVLRLPRGDPSAAVIAQLSDELAIDTDRPVVPVRVFWTPDGSSNRSKLAGFLAGRDPYRPNERQQRRTLRDHPTRARVVTGAPATVAELHQQWRDTTVAESPRDFARFVARRATLALERVEYRLLGPEYKSPSLVGPEILESARFRAGLAKIPAPPSSRPARCSTRWPPAGVASR